MLVCCIASMKTCYLISPSGFWQFLCHPSEREVITYCQWQGEKKRIFLWWTKTIFFSTKNPLHKTPWMSYWKIDISGYCILIWSMMMIKVQYCPLQESDGIPMETNWIISSSTVLFHFFSYNKKYRRCQCLQIKDRGLKCILVQKTPWA